MEPPKKRGRGRLPGYSHSPETKAKIAKSMEGKIKSEEVKEKISASLKGHVKSEETKRKISIAKTRFYQELNHKIHIAFRNAGAVMHHQVNDGTGTAAIYEAMQAHFLIGLKAKSVCRGYIEIPDTLYRFHVVRTQGLGWYVTLRMEVNYNLPEIPEPMYCFVWRVANGLGNFYNNMTLDTLEKRLEDKGCPTAAIKYIAWYIMDCIRAGKYKTPWNPSSRPKYTCPTCMGTGQI